MKEKCTSGCLDGADLFVRDAESTRATDLRTDSAHLLLASARICAVERQLEAKIEDRQATILR